jgi:hypothetical protein
VIELPMREVKPELMRLLEPAFRSLLEFENDGGRAVVELPIREVKPELMRLLVPVFRSLLEFENDGGRAVIELPIREVRPELIRLLELAFRPLPKLKNDRGEFEARLELMLPKLRVNPNLFDRDDDVDVLGLTILFEMLRFEKLELLGGRTSRELKLP